MKTSKPIFLPALCGLALGAISTRAQIIYDYSWSSFNGSSSLAIPDHNATGVSDIRTITLDPSRTIMSVTVSFQASGNFNGDLYLTLQHAGSSAVLLNRPGRDTGEPWGYDDSGLDITFQDGAAYGDIHTYRLVLTPEEGAALTGTWQPDGRTVDPASSLSSSPRTSFLRNFNALDASGEWTLFAADLSSGGLSQITGWGLSVTVVPEPAESILYTTLTIVLGFGLSRFLKKSKNRFQVDCMTRW